MFDKLRARNEWALVGALPQADYPLTIAWWAVLVLDRKSVV